MTRLDTKLARIRAGHYTRKDFIIADAKDGDMGSGITVAGRRREGANHVAGWKTGHDYYAQIKSIIAQDIVDIMLVSVSNLDRLQEDRAFAASDIKPAIRANDATDCWGGIRGGTYATYPSRPFRTAVLSRVMHGTARPTPGKPLTGTDLGLYSVTFNNDLDLDIEALNQFAAFRAEAAALDFKYFLEVFNPNAPRNLDPKDMPSFVNDCLLRCLSGVSRQDRPQFLKIPFNGPAALEELAAFDSSLVVGVLGGSSGTTRDTFELLYQSERYGARLALFGRKINFADSPLALVSCMRAVADGHMKPGEAVKAYHGALQTEGVVPTRPLDDDLEITEAVLK